MEDGKYLYFVDFENLGGLISPLPVTIEFADGSSEEHMIPAEIWRRNSNMVSKLFSLDKQAVSFKLDVAHQTADADFSNNAFPPAISKSRIELFKSNRSSSSMMADMLRELHSEKSDKMDSDGKKVPLGDAKAEDAESMKMKMDDKKAKPDSKARDTEKKKSSLRRTLERMLERK